MNDKSNLYVAIFFIVCLCNINLFSQNRNIDSLLTVLKTTKEDTNKVKILNNLSKQTQSIGNYDTAFYFANKAQNLSQKLNYKKGEAVAYHNIGNSYYEDLSKADKILENFLASLKIYEEILDENGIADSYTYIASIYLELSNVEKGIENINKAEKIYRKLADLEGLSLCLKGLGDAYFEGKNYEKSLENYIKALQLYKKINDMFHARECYRSIGFSYSEQKKYDKALENHLSSLKISIDLKDKKDIAYSYALIGFIYDKQKKYQNALECYLETLKFAKENLDTFDIACSYEPIAITYRNMGNYKESLKNYKIALMYFRELKEEDYYDIYSGLSETYAKMNDYKNAFHYRQRYSVIKDSITMSFLEMNNHFQNNQSKYELEKNEVEKKLQDSQLAQKEAQLKQETTQRYALFGGLILLIVFAGFMFNRFRISNKQNKLITEQKSVLEHQKQEITDSINYSKRIQTAILPDLNDIKQSLTDFFILYQPKDIVSGDFYYFNKVNNDVFIAAADCTGHGVPGAFMSLVGSKELKIANAMTNSPAQILKHLNNGVKDTLRQNHIDGTKDGMDIALVRINGTTVRYSAANRPLWILKKGSDVIEEIKATKTAIAGFTEDDFEFEEHEINLAKGDTIYLFSDGYADQFGGDKQKKMTTKRFREFVLSIKDKSMHEQQLELQSFFNSWQGNTEQVDDLLVIGIRI